MCVLARRPSDSPTPWQKRRRRRWAQILGSSMQHRAGRDIAAVGEQLVSFLGLLLIQAHQVGVGHVDLAAHFQDRRHVRAMQLERYAQHGADIVRDIVADNAITTRGPVLETALLVHERYGDAVDLQLDDPLDRFAGQELRDAPPVLAQFVDAVGVVDREHRPGMLDLRERIDRLIADALRRAVRADQLGMLGLELAQPLDQAIVIGVRDLGLGLDVVLPIVITNLLAQAFDLGLDVLRHIRSVARRGVGLLRRQA